MSGMKKILLLVPVLCSCSVMMASRRGGTDIETIQTIATRADLLALGATPISETTEDGKQTFLILKNHGSIVRAAMHGLLDVATGFLWELAGTPIEAYLSERKSFSIQVTFNNEHIEKIELL